MAFFAGTFPRGTARQEFFALRGHYICFFLAHRAAQDVGIAQRVSSKAVGDFHHLFLKDDDAPGFRKNFLQLRQVIGDFFLALFAPDEFVNHAALDWPGAIEGVERGEIFDLRGLVALQDVAHAVRFKLEDAGGIAAGEESVSRRVIERESGRGRGRCPRFCLIMRTESSRMVSVVKTEEIHFQQTDAPERIHVVLRGDFILVRLVQRNDLGERPRRNHDARGVRGGVARQAFQAQAPLRSIP